MYIPSVLQYNYCNTGCFMVLLFSGFKVSFTFRSKKWQRGEQTLKNLYLKLLWMFSHSEMSSFGKPGRQASDFWHNPQ